MLKSVKLLVGNVAFLVTLTFLVGLVIPALGQIVPPETLLDRPYSERDELFDCRIERGRIAVSAIHWDDVEFEENDDTSRWRLIDGGYQYNRFIETPDRRGGGQIILCWNYTGDVYYHWQWWSPASTQLTQATVYQNRKNVELLLHVHYMSPQIPDEDYELSGRDLEEICLHNPFAIPHVKRILKQLGCRGSFDPFWMARQQINWQEPPQLTPFIIKLLPDLDSDYYRVRRKAQQTLLQQGEKVALWVFYHNGEIDRLTPEQRQALRGITGYYPMWTLEEFEVYLAGTPEMRRFNETRR